MIIDLTRLKSGIDKEILIDEVYSFDKDYIKGTDLLELNNVKIRGKISKDSLNNLLINLDLINWLLVTPQARESLSVVYT